MATYFWDMTAEELDALSLEQIAEIMHGKSYEEVTGQDEPE
jgi:hypothetical protein